MYTTINDVADSDADQLGWQEQALCAQTDPEAWFPEKGGSTREARAICAGCPVRPQCLQYALKWDQRFGIWGGLSERERRKLRRGDFVNVEAFTIVEDLRDAGTMPAYDAMDADLDMAS